MKTYRVPGSETEWSPTGEAQTVQTTEDITFPAGTGKTLLMPITLTSQAETSRKGVRRVMVKVSAVVPRYTGNDMVDALAGAPISAHIVLTLPMALAQAGQYGEGTTIDPPALLAEMLADVVAVVSGKSIGYGADPGPGLTNPVLNALAGGQLIDPVSGSYGQASA